MHKHLVDGPQNANHGLSPEKREQNQSEEDLKPQTRSRMTVSPAVLKK